MGSKRVYKDADLYHMYVDEGLDYQEIADRCGFKNTNGVRGRISRYARSLRQRKPDTSPFPVEMDNGGETVLQPLLVPSFGNIPFTYGATVVSGDWHLITSEWSVVRLLTRFAEQLPKGQRRLAIVGDFINLAALSRYPHYYSPELLDIEFEAAEAAIEYLFETFDTIDYYMGNHEARLFAALNGMLSGRHFGRLVSKGMERGRLRVSKSSQGVIVAGGRAWRVTHQRNYSRNKGIVANRIAQKHQTDVMTFHEHHAAIGRDDFNRYTWINCPSLVDYEKLAYVMGFDSTANVMCNGFGFIDQDGVGHILTPYQSMTNWRLWGLERDPLVLEAQAAAVLKQARLTLPSDLLNDTLPELEASNV